MQTLRFERAEERNIRLHVMPTDRFKTYAVSLYIGGPLAEETVTSNALIPFVLRRGTEAYPETKSFREKLDDLYGAGFGFDIYKRGNNQIVQFRMDTIADRYAGGQEQAVLLKETIGFLLQVLSKPALQDGVFSEKYVSAEKATVRKKLESVINDKIRYAAERCTQEMFAGDPFRLNALGRIDRLDDIEPAALYQRYKEWLSSSQIDLYVVGDTTLEDVRSVVRGMLEIDRGVLSPYRIGDHPIPARSAANLVTEKLDVNQGKLNMGLTAPVYYMDSDYPAALMYNGILGGYPHSKLFTNVREKQSLAYYVSSRFDGYKGVMMIQSGIEVHNFEKAKSIIEQQLNAISSGEISDSELTQTQAMMSNQLKEVSDSAFEMIAFDFNSVLTGKERTVSSVIEAINQVTKDQIMQVAGKVKLDTIYFLRDRKGD